MGTVVDILITEYRMNASNYQAGAKAVVSATDLVSKAVRFGMGLVRGLRNALAAIAGVAALVGGYAVKQALDFDTLNRSLVAVTGSAERAKEILNFTDKLAVPSIFPSKDLAEAALTLEALQLRTERYLPVAEKLGTIFGGTADDLKQYVDALGYLKSGRGGEAMESLARAGISRDALKVKGIQFDGGGQLISSVQDALDAVEAIVNERFGKLSKVMADGPAAQLASLTDAIQRAARIGGNAILKYLVPPIKEVADFIQYLVTSGILKQATNLMLSFLQGRSPGDALVRILSFIVAVMKNMPLILLRVQNAFGAVGDRIAVIAAIAASVFLSGRIVAGITAIISAVRALTFAFTAGASAAELLNLIMTKGLDAANIAKYLATAAAVGAAAYAGAKALFDSLPSIQDIPGMDKIMQDAGDIYNGYKKNPNGASDTLSAITDAIGAGLAPRSDIAASQTASNTAKMVELQQKQLDLQQTLLGGGAIAREQLSGVRVAAAAKGGSRAQRKAMEAMADWFAEMSGMTVVSAKRHGLT
ncbi:MAG: hypothetical protein JST51_01460 [Armatimonadetes bacterium]|nr:hypothetical protein [Armatimonadota bacterium]